MIERKLLSDSDEALGIWLYSITAKGEKFHQQVRRALDGNSFITFVAHHSLRRVEQHELEVLEVIQAHTAFASLDDAIESGNAAVQNWRPEQATLE